MVWIIWLPFLFGTQYILFLLDHTVHMASQHGYAVKRSYNLMHKGKVHIYKRDYNSLYVQRKMLKDENILSEISRKEKYNNDVVKYRSAKNFPSFTSDIKF